DLRHGSADEANITLHASVHVVPVIANALSGIERICASQLNLKYGKLRRMIRQRMLIRPDQCIGANELVFHRSTNRAQAIRFANFSHRPGERIENSIPAGGCVLEVRSVQHAPTTGILLQSADVCFKRGENQMQVAEE